MKAVTAGAVIALATAVAGAALLAGIVAGSAIEAPGRPGDQVMRPAATSPITSTALNE
jgi:F0F1-type ATP synthase membrane subunit c/vacuolar-type H+-ATPase subunit K